MARCINCGNTGAEYQHYDGGYVCESCVGSYFTCPDCGRVFDQDDYENGDAGTINLAEAKKWYQKAATNGNRRAKNKLK